MPIKVFIEALKAGQQLSQPDVWANRATATAALVSILNVSVLALGWLGVDVAINSEEIHTIAAGLSAVAVIIADRIHVAANKDAGRR